MRKPQSQYESFNDQLLDQADEDIQIMTVWIKDAMEPVLICSKQKTILYEMESEIEEFIQKKGKSEKSTASLKRIQELLELNEKLFPLASENRMLQLSIQHAERRMSVLQLENKEFKKRLEATEKAWEASE